MTRLVCGHPARYADGRGCRICRSLQKQKSALLDREAERMRVAAIGDRLTARVRACLAEGRATSEELQAMLGEPPRRLHVAIWCLTHTGQAVKVAVTPPRDGRRSRKLGIYELTEKGRRLAAGRVGYGSESSVDRGDAVARRIPGGDGEGAQEA